MSSKYVLIEKSGIIPGSNVPNLIIHKVAEDMLLQTYALHLARVRNRYLFLREISQKDW